jgi:hypothetical protein
MRRLQKQGHKHKISALGSSHDEDVSVTVITVDNAVKTIVLGFRDYIFTMIFSDRSTISFGTR